MDIQTLRAEFNKILQDEHAAEMALGAVTFAASSSRGTLEPIASAYKIYLASGQPPYDREDLATAVAKHEKAQSVGLQSSLIDILYHGI
jgi:hypothetical protein